MILSLMASIMYWSLNRKGRVNPSSEGNTPTNQSETVVSEDGDYDNNPIDDPLGEIERDTQESEDLLRASTERTPMTN